MLTTVYVIKVSLPDSEPYLAAVCSSVEATDQWIEEHKESHDMDYSYEVATMPLIHYREPVDLPNELDFYSKHYDENENWIAEPQEPK